VAFSADSQYFSIHQSRKSDDGEIYVAVEGGIGLVEEGLINDQSACSLTCGIAVPVTAGIVTPGAIDDGIG